MAPFMSLPGRIEDVSYRIDVDQVGIPVQGKMLDTIVQLLMTISVGQSPSSGIYLCPLGVGYKRPQLKLLEIE